MPDPRAKVARMVQPESLKSSDFQIWSKGRGKDVWAMLCASIAGDLETIRSLVAGDPELVQCEYEYFTPLRFAIRENQRAVVDFLLQHGADPYEPGETLLAIARERGHRELAALLESKLREKFHVRPEAQAVVDAIKARDLAKVRALIEGQPDLVHAADERSNQLIHWAVMTRQIKLIDFLLERGADINAVRPDGLRPIHLTNGDYHYRGYRDLPPIAMQRHEVLIGYLMAKGAEVDISTAAKLGDLDRVRELADLDPGSIHRNTLYSYYTGLPLRTAAGAGNFEVVKFLLERGANPNEPEPGIAPLGGALHAAIGGKHLEIVKLLLEHGANPNAPVESSGNCLSMAKHVNAPKEMQDLLASYGGVLTSELADLETLGAMLHANPNLAVHEKLDHQPMMALILRYQPDLLKTIPDPTAWWSLATPKTPESTRWLIQHGLDPNRPNWLGMTLLHRCAAKGKIEIAQVCRDFGADLNIIESETSSTPLGWAAREGQKQMVEWLLHNRADPTLPHDEPWALPIAWARRRGHEEIAQLLARVSEGASNES